MKRKMAGIMLAVSMAAIAAIAPVSAAEDDVLPDDIAAIDVESRPAAVSPPGASILYTIDVRNSAPIDLAVTVTDATSNGSFVDFPAGSIAETVCVEPAAGTVDPQFSCTLTVAAGSTVRLDVIIASGSPGTTTNTAEVHIPADLQEVVTLNNSDTAITTVNEAGSGSAAFLREGESLTFKKHVLTVREAEFGVLAIMDDANGALLTCGGKRCNPEGLHVDFEEGGEGERYHGLVDVQVNFDNGDPCFGVGNSDCYDLYYTKPVVQPTPVVVPDCGTEGDGQPCLESVRKDGHNLVRTVVMETDDPDLLEQAKSLVKEIKA